MPRFTAAENAMLTEAPLRPTRSHSGRGPSFLARFAPFAAWLEREPAACLAALTFIVGLTTVARATRMMWFDELTTFYLARMDSIQSAWNAVRNGADLQPPLMFVLAHFSQKLAGANEIATRLPCILGFLVACGCLFVFIRRRSGTVFALCGAALILLTGAYRYSYEARPYGLVLAGAALALVSWQSATEPRRSWLSIAGIAAGLWIALASQCYAVLLAIPFGAGELVRTFQRKKIDWPVWLAFAASASAIAFYPPLIRLHDGGFVASHPLFTADVRTLWIVPERIVGGAGYAIALVMAIAAWLRTLNPRPRCERSKIPGYETVAVTLLAATPLYLALLIAEMHSSIFYRYALAAVIGFVVLASRALYLAAKGDTRIGAIVFLLLTGVFVERFISDAFARPDIQPPLRVVYASATEPPADSKNSVPGHPLLSVVPEDMPLVISDPFRFAQVAHYAAPGVAARTYYLTDAKAALHYTTTNSFETALPIMFRTLPIPGHVVPYSTFVSPGRRFFLYTSSNGFDWLMAQLGAENTELRFAGRFADVSLFDACFQCTPGARR